MKKLKDMTLQEVNDHYTKNCHDRECKHCACYGGMGCVLDYIPHFKYVDLVDASVELNINISKDMTIGELFSQLLERYNGINVDDDEN